MKKEDIFEVEIRWGDHFLYRKYAKDNADSINWGKELDELITNIRDNGEEEIR